MPIFFRILFLACTFFLSACGGPEGSGPLVAAASAGDYANTYSGTITGSTDANESGTLTLTINSNGDATGTATIQSKTYSLVGTVDAAGQLSLNLYANSQVAHIWTGTVVKSTGKISGTWRYAWSTAAGNDGTFTANKN